MCTASMSGQVHRCAITSSQQTTLRVPCGGILPLRTTPISARQFFVELSSARRGDRTVTRVMDPTMLASIAGHLPLLAEPVALPCSMMACGDVVHRSTLDLVLRGEQGGPDWRTFLLLATVSAYLFAAPGVLPGAFDYYVLAKMRNKRAYSKDDIVMGRKLATGGFGTVFKGEIRMEDGEMVPVIVKKAKEFGQAEAWMNERMMRLPGAHVAEFVTAFDETLTQQVPAAGKAKGLKTANALLNDAVWLVWKYEGDNTLWNMMESKDFPYNLEPLILDRELRLPKGVQRRAVTIRLVMKQLLQALEAAHSTGIVHRDIKPQNCIISERDKKIKLIDLGAAADLRIGINYAPSEYLLDPRYAPPQQYVMSTQTPTPPPAPVAAFLSPVLWRMETPDRFDMWSCGVTLLQMVFPSLRNDNAICAFNTRLKTLNYDLRAWRREEMARKGGMKPDMVEGFALLDLDNGAGWNLVCDLMAYKPADRCSATEALLSPFFTGSGVTKTGAAAALLPTMMTSAGKAVNQVLNNEVLSGIASSATGADRGSLTEAQLRQTLGLQDTPAEAPRRGSNTIAWWNERQSELRRSIEKREGSQATSGLPMKGSKAGSKGVRAGSNGNGRAGSPIVSNGRAGSPANGNGRPVSASPPLSRSASPPLTNVKSPSPLGGLFGKGFTEGLRALNLRSETVTAPETDSESSGEDEREVELVGQKAGSRPPAKSFNIIGMIKKK